MNLITLWVSYMWKPNIYVSKHGTSRCHILSILNILKYSINITSSHSYGLLEWIYAMQIQCSWSSDHSCSLCMWLGIDAFDNNDFYFILYLIKKLIGICKHASANSEVAVENVKDTSIGYMLMRNFELSWCKCLHVKHVMLVTLPIQTQNNL